MTLPTSCPTKEQKAEYNRRYRLRHPRPVRVVLTVRERFEEKWTPEPNTSCWLWTGGFTPDGYGAFTVKHGMRRHAHRVSWELYCSPIPFGMQMDHICRVRSCVNPDHLRVVTLAQNVLQNSVGRAAKNAAKTHCLRGHPLAGANVVVRYENGRPKRRCRECMRFRDRMAWARIDDVSRAKENARSLAGYYRRKALA